jgi:catalase
VSTSIYEEIVDALNAINGSHPGFRAVHAKGTVCRGRFEATPGASELSRAAHLQGGEVETTVRFSNASGNPNTSDAHPLAGRGMAVKFHLPGDDATDLVMVPLPVFMVRNAEDFLGFTKARAPDPETGQPDPEKLMAFVGEHPETARALQLGLPTLAPTTSFATSAFNGLHAFALVDSEGERKWGRWGWVPEAGIEHVPEDKLKEMPGDYLQTEIGERLKSGPAAFTLQFTLAQDGDSLDDPTEPWEGEHEIREMGRLEVTEVIDEKEAGDPLVFDPTNLTDGIEPSDDKILAARSPAYSVSIERRMASG